MKHAEKNNQNPSTHPNHPMIEISQKSGDPMNNVTMKIQAGIPRYMTNASHSVATLPKPNDIRNGCPLKVSMTNFVTSVIPIASE
mmetsp:Transcript_8382/g.19227  ORF Transcript_8382/g.19227 Transcript_8382/m.19227 type:complete len:85 (-) Transcript_8382:358-612(-)